MKTSRLALIVIIILVLLGGGWVYADQAKQKAVDEAVSEALRDNAMLLEMLGLRIEYAEVETSVFHNAVTFNDVSITRSLAAAGVNGVRDTRIDALTVDQNLPLFEMQDAVEEARIPTEFSLVIEGMDLDSTVAAIQQDTHLSPVFTYTLEKAIAEREQDTTLKSDMQFAYELKPGDSDRLLIDASMVLRQIGEIQLKTRFKDVNTQLFALLNLANTAQLQQLNLDYNGNAALNKAVMVSFAREAGREVEDYDEVAQLLIADLAPAKSDTDRWESQQLWPVVKAFIENPRGLSMQIKPTRPMTLNELTVAYQSGDKDVMNAMTLEAR